MQNVDYVNMESALQIRGQTHDVLFYSFYKDGEQIKTDSNNRFDLLNPNKLTEEPVKLYEKRLDRRLGDE
jgi:hypothetical protein